MDSTGELTARGAHNKSVGQRGEDFAVDWLQEHQHTILARNWRSSRGELDVVTLDRRSGEIVAVEVKTRSGEGFGHPASAVGQAKLVRLHRVLADFTEQSNQRFAARRVDVLALIWPQGAACPRAVDHYLGVTP